MRQRTLERRLRVLDRRRAGESNQSIARGMGLTESQVSSDIHVLRANGYDVPWYRSANQNPREPRRVECKRCAEPMQKTTPEMICGFCLEEEAA